VGESVRRREDAALIVGAGRFAADTAPGAAAMVVVRSPYAHARLVRVRLDAARAMPGVLAAWSAADAPLGERHLPDPQVPGIAHRPRPVLAGGAVRYQGEPVAVVVAETEAQAVDAVDVVDVEYHRLPGAGRAAAGQLAGETTLAFGDVEAAFAAAPVTIRRRLLASRVTGAAIEPRACAAVPVAGRRLLLHASTQWTHGVRDAVAGSLRMDPAMIDVVAEDVGGAFGGKGFPYPEEVLVAAAARALERPVRWVATRSEDGASTCQAHGTEIEVEAAADADGRLLGLRARFRHDCGAYTAAAFAQAENLAGHMLSMYRVQALRADVEFRVTNTAPARFIRGGARPIGNFAVERAMDALADRLGMDRVEIRRRNLLAPRELPFAHGLHVNGRPIVVDGSSYPDMLEAAVAAIGGSDEPGTGWGVACGIESSGMGRPTAAELALTADGMLTVRLGSAPQGQGHLTAFAQLAAARLGWPLERVTVVAGDTRIGPPAAQTAASRSAIEFGNATAMAATSMRRRLLDLAAGRLEASPQDLVIGPEGVGVRGARAHVGWPELLPRAGLVVIETFTPERARSWGPNCHAARVRVDPDTGAVQLLAYAIAHDAGPVINPAIVDGQVVGGLAHAVGYALFEELAYAEDGQLVGSTFLDYLLPGPQEVPLEPRIVHVESRSTQNPEGFRGVGEAGTIPAPAAILSAIESALHSLGRDAQLSVIPATPERVVRAAAGAQEV
jgi:carbon-monoxide dehydrogenase large subunit